MARALVELRLEHNRLQEKAEQEKYQLTSALLSAQVSRAVGSPRLG